MSETLKELFGGTGSGRSPAAEEKPDTPQKGDVEATVTVAKPRKPRKRSTKPRTVSSRERFFTILASQVNVVGGDVAKDDLKKMTLAEAYDMLEGNDIVLSSRLTSLEKQYVL